MTITVRLDAGPDGTSDLVETVRMAVGLALGEAPVEVVFTAAGRRWWQAVRTRDAASLRRLDELTDALEAVGGVVVGLTSGDSEAVPCAAQRLAGRDLLINSVGRLTPAAVVPEG
jgi:hypothetical protein